MVHRSEGGPSGDAQFVQGGEHAQDLCLVPKGVLSKGQAVVDSDSEEVTCVFGGGSDPVHQASMFAVVVSGGVS